MEVGTFHLLTQFNFIKRTNQQGELSYSEAVKILTGIHKIPTPLTKVIIKEMENLGLVECVNRRILRITNEKACHLLNNTSRLYKLVGLY